MSGTHVDELSVLTAASLQDSDVMYVGVPTDALDPDRQMTITEARKIFAFQDQANTFEQDVRIDAAKAVEYEDTDGTSYMRVRTASGVWKAIPFPSGSPDYGAEFSNDLSSGRWWFDEGVGIGSSADANHLDDYEEGTWTPTIAFGNAATGVGYDVQDGWYTKVGRLVTCVGRLILTSKGTATGNVTIESLPFTVGDLISGTSYDGGGYFTYKTNVNTTGLADWSLYPTGGGTTAGVVGTANANGGSATGETVSVVDSYFLNNTSLRFWLMYATA